MQLYKTDTALKCLVESEYSTPTNYIPQTEKHDTLCRSILSIQLRGVFPWVLSHKKYLMPGFLDIDWHSYIQCPEELMAPFINGQKKSTQSYTQ